MLNFIVLPHWSIMPQTTCHDTTPSHIILTLGWSVLALPGTLLVWVPSKEQIVPFLMTLVCRSPGSNLWPHVSRSGRTTNWANGACCFRLTLVFNRVSSWDYGTYHIGDQRRLRGACTDPHSLRRDPLEIQHPKFENSRLGFIVCSWEIMADATSLTPPQSLYRSHTWSTEVVKGSDKKSDI